MYIFVNRVTYALKKKIVFLLSLGRIELNLDRMPKPSKNAKKCGLHQIPETVGKKSIDKFEKVSLFEMKTMYGWWPVSAMEDGEQKLTVTYTTKTPEV